jgi:hypothetical protein
MKTTYDPFNAPLPKLMIADLFAGEVHFVQINPTSIEFSLANEMIEAPIPSVSDAKVHYGGTARPTASFEIIYDRGVVVDGVERDCRAALNFFASLHVPDERAKSAPACRFFWPGAWNFTAYFRTSSFTERRHSTSPSTGEIVLDEWGGSCTIVIVSPRVTAQRMRAEGFP